MAGDVVGYLQVLVDGVDPDETQREIEIRGNEEFILGRSSALCRQHWPDPRISNRHLRIHCILYEQDFTAGIPPFVYATDLSTNGTYLKKSNTDCVASQGQGVLMGRRNGSFLLDDGDKLRLSNCVTLVYHSCVTIDEGDMELTSIQETERKLFALRFLITNRALGVGGYGKVMMAIHQKTQRQMACKIIDIHHLTSNQNVESLGDQNLHLTMSETKKRWPPRASKFFREFDILKDLSHPNIVGLEKVLWSSNTIYIFQELVTGGDLFSFIQYKGGRLCDVEAAVIVRQILKGVEYLHERDIVHRDLKPDNILMTSLDDGARVIITDFGNARSLPNKLSSFGSSNVLQRRMFSYVGTLDYAAPEIHQRNYAIPADQGYSKSVDMWSVGTITTALIGDSLFVDVSDPRYDQNPASVILELAASCNLHALDDGSHAVWSRVGHRPKDFIKQLLVLQEDRRMTASEALAHPWFSNKHHVDEFNALYKRAIQDWRPRRKVFRLVESVPSVSADLSSSVVAQDPLSQELVSRYFAPPQRQVPLFDIRGSLAVAQRRANTLLPSILEEHEDLHCDMNTEQYAQERYSEDIPANSSQHSSISHSLDRLRVYCTDDAMYDEHENDGHKASADGRDQDSLWINTPDGGDDHSWNLDSVKSDEIIPETPLRPSKRKLTTRSPYPRKDDDRRTSRIADHSSIYAELSYKPIPPKCSRTEVEGHY
ncbi:kinase-like protein [Amniculicola lignicola CBS 123094]|uniref:Kinase-like protein n=1 Tax=Amniculicola lignicola CBS 123094 TaxID=1392246 RepID=A0A6A5WTI4_9PLEO|nr:kinase-like protein [Amniculicola lignicola CBS 123094]